MITAHSGSDGTKENSIEFINTFLNEGIEAIEIDVRKDDHTNELYLSHDKSGTSNHPLLRDCLKIIVNNPNLKVNCDLKEENLEKDVIQLFKEFNLFDSLIFSGTVNVSNINENNRPIICFNVENIINDIYTNYDNYSYEYIIETIDCYFKEKHITVLNINYKFCSDKMIEDLKRRNIDVSLWTVDDSKQRIHYIKENVYNITTRQVRDAIKERKCLNI